MQLKVLVAVRACAEFGSCFFFEVEARLARVESSSPLVLGCASIILAAIECEYAESVPIRLGEYLRLQKLSTGTNPHR